MLLTEPAAFVGKTIKKYMNIPKLKHLETGQFFLMAGSCAIESRDLAFEIAEKIKKLVKIEG